MRARFDLDTLLNEEYTELRKPASVIEEDKEGEELEEPDKCRFICCFLRGSKNKNQIID